ncbi:MAG: DNA polymerase III subunit beta, partial [Acidimicrobiia bacterium]|nr:DNA polymerase III subunit beta [Acidimicrobiia bacterium]
YLADGVVSTGAEKVRLRIIDGMKPSVIDDPEREEFLYLLMPVNV